MESLVNWQIRAVVPGPYIRSVRMVIRLTDEMLIGMIGMKSHNHVPFCIRIGGGHERGSNQRDRLSPITMLRLVMVEKRSAKRRLKRSTSPPCSLKFP